MDLETAVREQIDKLNIPETYKIKISPYSKVYPHSLEPKSSQSIKISFGSNNNDYTRDNACSFLDFWYNDKESRIEHVRLSLKGKLKDVGFGRRLVEAMEIIGKEGGCCSVRINSVTNPSFWEYMGYQKYGKYLEKKL